ncbi:MAG: PaaI family thioesterase [Zoogloeaceae bacterium]|jgi:acyl-CoA thioesterase|nr:PaaI family thioesterase [Zoogloeaceae bacterium]
MPLPDLEAIRAFFSADRFAASCGVVIEEASKQSVCCFMPVTAAHLNAGNTVQGGALFTLADFTFAVHANLSFLGKETESVTVGQSNQIVYLAAPRGDFLRARSTCLSSGRNISVFRVDIEDAEGRHVAEMLGNGVRKIAPVPEKT